MGDDKEIEFADLPERTKKFLADLPPDKWQTLLDAAALFDKAVTVGKFMKWLIISVIAAFITTVSLGESIGKLLGIIKQP